jgi:hypothetical protein
MKKVLLVAGVAGTALFTACSDVGLTDPRGGGGASLVADYYALNPERDRTNELERVAVNDLALSLAVVLNDDDARQNLYAEIRSSRHTIEHKVDLWDYLSASGKETSGKMSRAADIQKIQEQHRSGQIRGMEIYMPVDAHRAQWNGGRDLIVAYQIEEEDEPIGYSLSGEVVKLSLDAPPSTPVIVIVPTETDFTEALPAEYVNVSVSGAIGTYEARNVLEDHPDIAQYVVTGGASGIAMTYSFIDDLREPWTKGDPEIEVHVIAPTPTSEWTSLSWAGWNGMPSTEPFRKFDQNSKTWTGQVLLITDSKLHDLSIYNPEMNLSFMFWEDDNNPGTIISPMSGDNLKLDLAKGIAAFGAGYVFNQTLCSSSPNPIYCNLIGSLIRWGKTTIQSAASGNDDYIGTVHNWTNSSTNLAILKDGKISGWTKIVR